MPTPAPPSSPRSLLSSTERAALGLCRFANENRAAKRVQRFFHRHIGNAWVTACIRNLLHVEGLEHVRALDPTGGVMLCANHRSFFDQYVVTSVLLREAAWVRSVYFPVRSNFFYDRVAGVAVNLLVGGLAMYPPIFRDPARSALNKDALQKVIDLLGERGAVVGMHPEGTRGKGPDPYQLLPAQPGVGQVIVRARPTVVPVFVNGLKNDFVEQISSNFRRGERRGDPIVVVFGEPVDFGTLLEGNPRPALYKRAADRVLDELRVLGARERAVRAALPRR